MILTRIRRLYFSPSPTFGYSSIACAWITTAALGSTGIAAAAFGRTRIAGPAFGRTRIARPAFGRAGIASAAGLRRAWIASGGIGLRTARHHQTDSEHERNDRRAKQPASGCSDHCFVFLPLDLFSGRYTGFWHGPHPGTLNGSTITAGRRIELVSQLGAAYSGLVPQLDQ